MGPLVKAICGLGVRPKVPPVFYQREVVSTWHLPVPPTPPPPAVAFRLSVCLAPEVTRSRSFSVSVRKGRARSPFPVGICSGQPAPWGAPVLGVLVLVSVLPSLCGADSNLPTPNSRAERDWGVSFGSGLLFPQPQN